MKMVTLELKIISEEDETAEDVKGRVDATLDMLDVEWLETTIVSEDPYAEES